jgi:hypothetical protein
MQLSSTENRVFQLAASGFVSAVKTIANGLNLNYRSGKDIFDLSGWLRTESGQDTSLGLILPKSVYDAFLRKFENFSYGTVSVTSGKEAPTDPTVVGSTISCDEPASGVVSLLVWNSTIQMFTDTGYVGSISGGRVSFTSLDPGFFVMATDSDGFCTPFLEVTA